MRALEQGTGQEDIMIKIVARTKFKEECVETVKELARELVLKSRAEDGNISYTFNQSIKDSTVLTMIEYWKDKEAIATHNASEHFQTIFPQMAQYAAEKPTIDLYVEIEY